MAVPGAFGVTTATLLGLMQREWERPASEDETSRSFIEQVSPKLILELRGHAERLCARSAS
jgi:hypothetical protein